MKVEFTEEVVEAIDQITLLTGIATTEVIKSAIATELHIQKHIK